jgi:hypothetical protein
MENENAARVVAVGKDFLTGVDPLEMGRAQDPRPVTSCALFAIAEALLFLA